MSHPDDSGKGRSREHFVGVPLNPCLLAGSNSKSPLSNLTLGVAGIFFIIIIFIFQAVYLARETGLIAAVSVFRLHAFLLQTIT